MSRQVVLDTETTGLEARLGHRVIEIGAVEIINRRPTGRHYHQYLNPERAVDAGALAVHGLGDEFLADKPLFAEIAAEFLQFIDGAELIIHNAPFEQLCAITDTLKLARNRHPGQKNSLDALCTRYGVDNSARQLHGALLDAEILADLYLLMTSGQVSLSLDEAQSAAIHPGSQTMVEQLTQLAADRPRLPVIAASAEELARHEAALDAIARECRGEPLWRRLL
jgi:DNA polymerase-3 subunit epsilon